MELFPYPPRVFQAEAVAVVSKVAAAGGHLALEAPTGTGKTVLLLAGALQSALAAQRSVLYVTRTNSQQEQAVREVAAIRKATGRPIRVLALQGRQRLCLKLEDAEDPELAESSAEDLSHYCGHAKREAEADPDGQGGCEYYRGLLRRNDADLSAALGPEPLTAEAFKGLGRTGGFCSYEATKRLLPTADVVVAPYVFAFDLGLRARLLQWWQKSPGEVVLIVDEAHNLPGYLRELSSPRLGRETLRRALSESEALGHPLVTRAIGTRPLLETMAEVLDAVVAEYAKEDDGFVPPYEVESELLGQFRVTSHELRQATEHMIRLGEVIKDRRRLMGKIPKSALSSTALFLQRWMDSDESAFVKVAVREPRPYLEAFCVDVTDVAASLHDFHATIHASGTLNPLAEYRDTLGLGEETLLERFPSPFPPDRLTIHVARDLTTRFEQVRNDPKLVDRLQEAVRAFVTNTRVSAAVFFPSHRMLEEFREVGAFETTAGQLLVESRDLTQEALMRLVHDHRSSPGRSVLVGVMGGRLSEGMDFPGRQLEALLIVGVPFPKPTARQRSIFRYYEAKHGKGWDYAVKAPAVRRLRQALGRLIRSPQDAGIAIILDERALPLLQEAQLSPALASVPEIVDEYRRWQASSKASPT